MEKLWLNSYPPGVPAEIGPDEFGSLTAMFEQVCARHASLPAFSNQGTTLGYSRLDALSRAFAGFLQNVAHVGRGERVAIMLPNLLQYPVALFGALRAGCVVVNTNPLYTGRELQYQLNDSGASAIVVLDNFAHTLQQVLGQTAVRCVVTTGVGDMLHFPKAQIVNMVVKHVRHMVPEWQIAGAVGWADALHRGEQAGLTEAGTGPDDIAFLQYTGGTTGVPKGAILPHRSIVANVEQTAAWIAGVLNEGEEALVVPLPMYHIFALTAMLTFLRIGSEAILITNPRDLPAFVKELRHVRFSAMIGVNTLFNALLDAPHIDEVDVSRVKVVVAGGMALQRAVAERWQRRFGLPLIEGYGLTEASPIVCANPLTINSYTGTIGLPLPSTEVAILDDGGCALPLGEPGELCVRGPQLMRGYWNKPEETARVLTSDGWLRTGDIGVIEGSGYVKIVDRKKDMIVVSGFKVFPNEIEDVVAMHSGVAEVAAIPVADARSGEAVRIVVVRKNPELTESELLDHCRTYLTGYKVPRSVVFRSSALPKSNIGKVLRRVVREQEEQAAQGMRGDTQSPAPQPAA